MRRSRWAALSRASAPAATLPTAADTAADTDGKITRRVARRPPALPRRPRRGRNFVRDVLLQMTRMTSRQTARRFHQDPCQVHRHPARRRRNRRKVGPRVAREAGRRPGGPAAPLQPSAGPDQTDAAHSRDVTACALLPSHREGDPSGSRTRRSGTKTRRLATIRATRPGRFRRARGRGNDPPRTHYPTTPRTARPRS